MEKENGRANMKVMVVIDERECSYLALMWVLDFLKESIKHSPLVIFAAQPPPNCNYVVSSAVGFARICPLSATMDLFNSVQQQNKKVALGLLEKAERICASKGVIVEAITEAGYPEEVICDAVQKCGVNLLVIGDKENGNIKRALQGSVSSYCVQDAKCQVLLTISLMKIQYDFSSGTEAKAYPVYDCRNLTEMASSEITNFWLSVKMKEDDGLGPQSVEKHISTLLLCATKIKNRKLVSGGDCIKWDQKSTEIAIKSRQSLESEAKEQTNDMSPRVSFVVV
ncbi:hypothetical protein OIU85_006006 [Salix viminalis]|uniref:UspA domain-containing protein n=1 Tax=Salix viminalis TaxID=40686 RepID=A0A9Q0PK26_SALVM|nr:hypothetical protein OIU85_006006 [Salix viminalis]